MPFIDWSDEQSVNVSEIDRQHQNLIAVINRLHELVVGGTSEHRAVLTPILHELRAYGEYHFATEEHLMRKYDFPRRYVHIQEHQGFIFKVDEFTTGYQTQPDLLSLQVLSFLQHWLMHHIREVDRQLGEFLNAKGIS